MAIELVPVRKNHPDLKRWMSEHYSQPKGFVGRQIIYLVTAFGDVFGAIAGGSATRFLPGRLEFLGAEIPLNRIVNNTFFHVSPLLDGKYPLRNFTARTVEAWRDRVARDWTERYYDPVHSFETLVELPRTGELYLRDKWTLTGQTVGYTCKRVAGESTDTWTGRRVWNTTDLRPKHVFMRLK